MNKHSTGDSTGEHLVLLLIIDFIHHTEFIAHRADKNENGCWKEDERYRDEAVAGPQLSDRIEVHKPVKFQTVVENQGH